MVEQQKMSRVFFDRIAEICEVAREEVTVTVFVYETRLGGLQYRRLVDQAVSAGLIEKTDTIYRTTEKGETYLTTYQSLQKLLRAKRVPGVQ